MKGVKKHLCKIAAFFLLVFISNSALAPTPAAAAVTKPIRIEQLSDGGGFFVLTFQDKVHPSMPVYSFDIYAIALGRGANYQARRIIVTETATKEVVQEVSLSKLSRTAEYPSTSQWETMGFVIEDMNFDGYQDIRIIAFMPGGTRIPYFYWFWDNNAQKFVRNTALEEITAPVFDQVKRTISSSVNTSEAQSYNIVYKYVNSVPVTKEDHLKSLAYLVQMETNLKDQNAGTKKKTLSNCYKGWNEELNNIFTNLLKEVSPEKAEELKASQRAWLSEREKTAKEASTIEPDNSLAYNYSLMLSTKNRTLALIDTFFDGEKK